MPAKIAQISPWIVFGMPEVPVAVRTSLLSCRKAEKPRISKPVRESSGKSRIKAVAWLSAISHSPFGRKVIGFSYCITP